MPAMKERRHSGSGQPMYRLLVIPENPSVLPVKASITCKGEGKNVRWLAEAVCVRKRSRVIPEREEICEKKALQR